MTKKKSRKSPITIFYDKYLYMRSTFYPQETLEKKKATNKVRRKSKRCLKKHHLDYPIPA